MYAIRSYYVNNTKKINKKEALEIFMTLHSTQSRSVRFNHDHEFVRNNNIEKINTSIRHLIDEEIELGTRISDLINGDYKLSYFGDSAVREFNGWMYPDKYPIRNEKSDKALAILGFR